MIIGLFKNSILLQVQTSKKLFFNLSEQNGVSEQSELTLF